MGWFSRKSKDSGSGMSGRGGDLDALESMDADELEDLDAAEGLGAGRRTGGGGLDAVDGRGGLGADSDLGEVDSLGQVGVDGPYDRSEVQDPQGRLELGSLWVIGLPGMQLRLDVTEDSGAVTSCTIAHAGSSMQLQAFAAPKSSGLWEEIRAEIADSVQATGGSSEESAGRFGAELLARMPGQGPGGGTVFHPARFLGVDGPRWFLRAVITGPAATDEAAAEPLLVVLAATVVDRGENAMAPRELLPLVLPDANAADPSGVEDEAPLGRLRRGPEITQIG